MTLTPTMFAVHRDVKGIPSFALITESLNSPFVEVIYDPTTKTLYVIGKSIKDDPQFLTKLDDNGNVLPNTKVKDSARMERKIFPAYYEYRITDRKDISDFLDKFCVNTGHPALQIAFPAI